MLVLLVCIVITAATTIPILVWGVGPASLCKQSDNVDKICYAVKLAVMMITLIVTVTFTALMVNELRKARYVYIYINTSAKVSPLT